MATDLELLKSYTLDRVETAFTELVQRHINLVYGAALRETRGDTAQAEDLTQMVFTELARKGKELTRHPALAGWLYTCVRRMAANARRSGERRQHRELAAHAMNELLTPDDAHSAWAQIRPQLDDALHELSDGDRTAVVMRLLEDQSLRDIGQSLGLSENAARMRVDRALEKLRSLLAKRGITSTASGLTAAIAVGALGTAPAGMAANIAATALATTTAVGTTAASTLTILNIMATTKLKVVLACAVASAAVTLGVIQVNRPPPVEVTTTLPEPRPSRNSSSPPVPDPASKSSPAVQPSSVDPTAPKNAEELRAQIEVARKRAAATAASLARVQQLTPPPAVTQASVNPEADQARRQKLKLARLAQMKMALNLSPQQEAAIKSILFKQAELEPKQEELGRRHLRGAPIDINDEQFMAIARESLQLKKEFDAQLSPEQQAALKGLEEEDLVASRRIMVNQDLAIMQSALHLSMDQQDKVFTSLYNALSQTNAASAEPFPRAPNPNDAEAYSKYLAVLRDRAVAAKRKALDGVLSPEQLDLYLEVVANGYKMSDENTKIFRENQKAREAK